MTAVISDWMLLILTFNRACFPQKEGSFSCSAKKPVVVVFHTVSQIEYMLCLVIDDRAQDFILSLYELCWDTCIVISHNCIDKCTGIHASGIAVAVKQ